MLPVHLWEHRLKSSFLPVHRKYQKGQQRDGYTILFIFHSRYKRRWINVIVSAE